MYTWHSKEVSFAVPWIYTSSTNYWVFNVIMLWDIWRLQNINCYINLIFFPVKNNKFILTQIRSRWGIFDDLLMIITLLPRTYIFFYYSLKEHRLLVISGNEHRMKNIGLYNRVADLQNSGWPLKGSNKVQKMPVLCCYLVVIQFFSLLFWCLYFKVNCSGVFLLPNRIIVTIEREKYTDTQHNL